MIPLELKIDINERLFGYLTRESPIAPDINNHRSHKKSFFTFPERELFSYLHALKRRLSREDYITVLNIAQTHLYFIGEMFSDFNRFNEEEEDFRLQYDKYRARLWNMGASFHGDRDIAMSPISAREKKRIKDMYAQHEVDMEDILVNNTDDYILASSGHY